MQQRELETTSALEPARVDFSGAVTAHLPPSIPDHELVRPIGRGAYGEVWLARTALGTPRAVKVVYRSSFEDERPFEREFSGIQRFEPISRAHEGFVDVLQIGRNDGGGYFYYVMELADSVSGSEFRVSGSTDVSQLETRNSKLETYSPRTLRSLLRPSAQPSTLNSQPSTLNPQLSTLNRPESAFPSANASKSP